MPHIWISDIDLTKPFPRRRPPAPWLAEVPYPEVSVARADDQGDFRDAAHEVINTFRDLYGRWPNYCAVTLEQVEHLEASSGVRGIEHVSHIARGTIPLLFIE